MPVIHLAELTESSFLRDTDFSEARIRGGGLPGRTGREVRLV
jgi:hypothetical protein